MRRADIIKLKSSTASAIIADAELTKALARVSWEVWGLSPSACTKILRARIARIKQLNIDKMADLKKCKYKLKDDVVMYVASRHEHYSNANLTDEVAEAIVKENPSLRDNFAIAPEEEQAGTKSSDYTAEECFVKIAEAQDAETLEMFLSDKRVTVKKAAEDKMDALAEAAAASDLTE